MTRSSKHHTFNGNKAPPSIRRYQTHLSQRLSFVRSRNISWSLRMASPSGNGGTVLAQLANILNPFWIPQLKCDWNICTRIVRDARSICRCFQAGCSVVSDFRNFIYLRLIVGGELPCRNVLKIICVFVMKIAGCDSGTLFVREVFRSCVFLNFCEVFESFILKFWYECLSCVGGWFLQRKKYGNLSNYIINRH